MKYAIQVVKKSKKKSDLKVTHGTAIYTGGGIYNIIGEFNNGLWFCGGPDFISVINVDVRTKSTEVGVEDELAFYYGSWLTDHEVKEYYEDEAKKREMYETVEDFCKRLDKKEPGLTDGYEEYSNYCPGEVTEMIDFTEFDGYKKGEQNV